MSSSTRPVDGRTGQEVLVTGGTGLLGRLVVPRLRSAGRDVRILSRDRHEDADGVRYAVGDLADGSGVADALRGVRTVVHLAGEQKGDDAKARVLVAAAGAADVGHLVFVSVVGADRVPVVTGVDRAMFGYFAAKRAAEQVIESSGVPFTTLRATQFHEAFLAVAASAARLPVMPAFAGVRFQPVSAVEVADRVAELALGDPAGLVEEMGGPEVIAMDDLLRRYLRRVGTRRPILRLRTPGAASRSFRQGANLCPGHAGGEQTWDAFLHERVVPSRPDPA